MLYSELFAAIQSWTENTFPATTLADGSTVPYTTQINQFITQAERRIYNSVQLATTRKTATVAMTSGDSYVLAPNDFQAAYSLAVIDGTGAYSFLLVKDPNFIREVYPSPTTTGLPRYYAIFGPQVADDAELRFLVGPTPDAAYSGELQYFAYPESIVTAGNTWLGDNYEHVLLYGCLVEASVFMKGDAEITAAYEAKFKDALAQLKQTADGKQRGDTYRNGQIKVPVV